LHNGEVAWSNNGKLVVDEIAKWISESGDEEMMHVTYKLTYDLSFEPKQQLKKRYH
jgi:hypothetical protein